MRTNRPSVSKMVGVASTYAEGREAKSMELDSLRIDRNNIRKNLSKLKRRGVKQGTVKAEPKKTVAEEIKEADELVAATKAELIAEVEAQLKAEGRLNKEGAIDLDDYAETMKEVRAKHRAEEKAKAKPPLAETDEEVGSGTRASLTLEELIERVEDELEDAPTLTPNTCLLYTSPSPRDRQKSRMPSSA